MFPSGSLEGDPAAPQYGRMSVPDLVAFAKRELPLADARLSREYYYADLGICVLDSVFSLGIRYDTVRHVVRRYTEFYGLPEFRPFGSPHPPIREQQGVSALAERIRETGAERFAADVVRNRCRTSPRSGILKAEATLRFAEALVAHDVNFFQDVQRAANDRLLYERVRTIPGQKSGISLQYLWMLAGDDSLVKPDRMVRRFFERALGRPVGQEEADTLATATARALAHEYPALTPRLFDYVVWQHERA